MFGSIHLVGIFDGRRSTLVHELAHASFRILDRVGIETPADSKNEAFCYLLDTLYDFCEPHIKRKKT